MVAAPLSMTDEQRFELERMAVSTSLLHGGDCDDVDHAAKL